MIIWGSKGREKKIAEGNFFCPRCGQQRPFIHKRIGKYFTLYFIPLFETSKLGEYVECKFCLTPYEVSILETQNELADIINVIQSQLEQGIPVNVLLKNLKEDGISEDNCKNLLIMATKGELKICNRCELFYSSILKFCSICGDGLAIYRG